MFNSGKCIVSHVKHGVLYVYNINNVLVLFFFYA